MRIAIGCDEAACAFRDAVREFLKAKGHEVEDFGTFDAKPVLYPDIAVAVCESITGGKNERGILICGTGLGMCMMANKVPGIRAAVCHDPFSAARSRKSNDAQVMCMGARVIAPQLGLMLVEQWLECEFEGGGSTAKVDRMMEHQQRYLERG